MNIWRLHRIIVLIIALMATFSGTALCHSTNKTSTPLSCLPSDVFSDYRDFYAARQIRFQLLAFGSAAIMANTDFDPIIQKNWQNHFRSPSMNDVFEPFNTWGDITQYQYAIPVYAILLFTQNDCIAQWANHTLRSLLLGGPLQAIGSYALGSGRPATLSPQWHFFKYHRAISGHAFYGALPFINLAMQTDCDPLKMVFYGASLLPGLARINNDSHYFSQVFLGWWLAFSASKTVWQSNQVSIKSQKLSWQVIPTESGISLEVFKKF